VALSIWRRDHNRAESYRASMADFVFHCHRIAFVTIQGLIPLTLSRSPSPLKSTRQDHWLSRPVLETNT
jgi:hypothetical protein